MKTVCVIGDTDLRPCGKRLLESGSLFLYDEIVTVTKLVLTEELDTKNVPDKGIIRGNTEWK